MRGVRILVVLGAVAVLAAAFVLVRPDGDEGSPEPAPTGTTQVTTATTAATTAPTTPERVRIVVTVRDGRPVGGIARATARKDDPILLVVRADVVDHVHVHGYDLMADVGPGRPVRMQFRATLTGRFEIELEDRAQQIAQLTVLP